MIMIRIKHEGKCRKVSQPLKTIEDLKAKITELFGSSAAKLDITYKDCDGELVSVVDTEDLQNCIEEAESYKMTCVTLLLKDDACTSRSASSKRSSQSSSDSEYNGVESSDEEQEQGFAVIGKAKVAATPQEQEINLRLIEEQQKAEVEQIKKRLIEEHQKTLAELDAHTNSKIEKVQKQKHKGAEKSKDKAEIQKVISKIKTVDQVCKADGIQNPVVSASNLFKELKEEFPQLAYNPALVNLVLQDANEIIRNALKNSCQKVISYNPEIAKLSEENKAKFGAAKCRVRNEKNARHSDESKAEKEARKAAKRALTSEQRELKQKEKEAHKLQKAAEKAEKQAKKAEQKQAKAPKSGRKGAQG